MPHRPGRAAASIDLRRGDSTSISPGNASNSAHAIPMALASESWWVKVGAGQDLHGITSREGQVSRFR